MLCQSNGIGVVLALEGHPATPTSCIFSFLAGRLHSISERCEGQRNVRSVKGNQDPPALFYTLSHTKQQPVFLFSFRFIFMICISMKVESSMEFTYQS